MKKSSREARLSAARKKKDSVRPLTDEEKADCRALRLAIERYNKALPPGTPRSERLSNQNLAKYSGPLGGSPTRQAWSSYRTGRVKMRFIDTVIFAQRIDRAPAHIFPSWKKFEALGALRPSLLLVLATAAQQPGKRIPEAVIAELSAIAK